MKIAVVLIKWAGILGFGLMANLAYSNQPEGNFVGEFPVVSGKGTLTVSGNGYWHRENYMPGDRPNLSAFGIDGVLPDGIYQYELRSIPSNAPSSQRQMNVLRGKSGNSGFNKQQPVPTVSGKFEIQGGQVVAP